MTAAIVVYVLIVTVVFATGMAVGAHAARRGGR